MILSNVYTTDSYDTTPAQVTGIHGIAVLLHIIGAAVYMRRQRDSAGSFENEILLAPGTYTLRRRIHGVQFRSAITGIPALMNIEVVERHD